MRRSSYLDSTVDSRGRYFWKVACFRSFGRAYHEASEKEKRRERRVRKRNEFTFSRARVYARARDCWLVRGNDVTNLRITTRYGRRERPRRGNFEMNVTFRVMKGI